jgi:hypothetical protein
VFQIEFHGSDWTLFYEQVPKENPHTEYGEEAGTVAGHWGMADCGFVFKFRDISDSNA